ncbi:Imm10 family immunity protein [Xanthomonas cannabis]|uniref:Imm10 family immunity protein n=1 Tax=Xanthomonas cannabis TaxID=1885674 RepID=UPI00141AECFA|nr:Imm10 family immunity protein [Xanthomonas cannabis]
MYFFNAKDISVEDDGYAMVVGLVDDPSNPSKFVILQRTKFPDAQDKALGLDKMHIELGGENKSRYGGVECIEIKGIKLKLSISSTARSELGLKGDIEVNLPEEAEMEKLKESLAEMCQADGVKFIR